MRKIETLMNKAIQQEIDWKLDNTEVISCSNVTDVFLHGNLIARVGETWLELFDGGWQTATSGVANRWKEQERYHKDQANCFHFVR